MVVGELEIMALVWKEFDLHLSSNCLWEIYFSLA
jgi:hypothetical protein